MLPFKDYLECNDEENSYNKEEMKRAKHADLIPLPKGVIGTNCGNCKYFKKDFCNHHEVKLRVDERQCCKYWDHDAVKRPWE